MSQYTKSTNFATKDNLSPGDPLKIVRGTEIDTEFNNIATAISTKTDNSAAAITGGSITGITDLAVADGGTGASTATAALNNLLPSQTSNANKYLQTDGTNATWDAVSLSTADITGTLPVANGGTGVTASTGTGSVVLSNSPTLVTPALGTPASGTLTNATGLPISTGVSGLGTGVATFLGTPSSANLISAVTDETGSGALVFANSPTLVTPALGTPSALVGTNITGTASGLTAGNVTTNANLTGAITSVGNATSLGSFTSSQLAGALTDETGSGSAVFATSPTLVTPILGTPTSATLTNATGLPIATGVSGLGTGVATALAVNVGSSGAPLVNGGVLGTPSSGTATNLTGLPLTTGVTGILPTANGGTNLTSFTSGGVVYASSSSALATGSALTFDGTNLGLGANITASASGAPSFTVGTGSGAPAITLYSATNSASQISFADATTGSGAYDGYLLYNQANQNMVFAVAATEGMRLTSTGLGIGTSSPSGKLHVSTTGPIISTLESSAANGGYLTFSNSSTVPLYIGFGSTLTTGLSTSDAAFRYSNNLVFSSGATEVGRFTSGGNLLVGTTANANSAKLKSKVSGGSVGFEVTDEASSDFVVIPASSAGVCKIGPTAGAMSFQTAGTERARIDSSGNLLVGTTSNSFGGRVIVSNDGTATQTSLSCINTFGSGTMRQIDFFTGTNTSRIGSIESTTSLTLFNTTSDYRLKNSIAPMTGALAKVALLKPCTYKWNADGSNGQGFIAHELAEVVPECVSGAKDAVNAKGNPEYQGIDTSFLVATLTAAIQELDAKFEAYKASHP